MKTLFLTDNRKKRALESFQCERQITTNSKAGMRWMKLEPIIQSEVSQKEKHQYSILTHIYGI